MRREGEEQPATSARELIADDVRTRVQNAGVGVEEAIQHGELWGSIATTLAGRAGIDAMQLWRRIRPLVLGPEASRVQQPSDVVDDLLARMRAGETAEGRTPGPSLVETIRAQGGIVDETGELAALDVGETGGAVRYELIRQPNGDEGQAVSPGQEVAAAADAVPERRAESIPSK